MKCDGGEGFSGGISASGSPIIFCSIRNFSGRSARSGRVLRATGLYFFLVVRYWSTNSVRLPISVDTDGGEGETEAKCFSGFVYVEEGDDEEAGESIVEKKTSSECDFINFS